MTHLLCARSKVSLGRGRFSVVTRRLVAYGTFARPTAECLVRGPWSTDCTPRQRLLLARLPRTKNERWEKTVIYDMTSSNGSPCEPCFEVLAACRCMADDGRSRAPRKNVIGFKRPKVRHVRHTPRCRAANRTYQTSYMNAFARRQRTTFVTVRHGSSQFVTVRHTAPVIVIAAYG
jgi:hypothetical protein